MRAKVGKALREQFTTAIRTRVSGFEPVNDKWAGKQNRLFRLKTAGRLSFFLFLQVDDKEDQFTIEASWSMTGRYAIDGLPDEPRAYASNSP